jgi:tRNA threonylcarbamoyladenosine biosynthesis protein TsaB
MVVLALETVTRAGSVALLVDEACDAAAGDPNRTHGERLPGELLALLARHGRQLHDVDRFAVITGPGSFTGLRVGIAAMQGLAIASARTVVPLPTLDAMAQAWINHGEPASSIVVACLDGHRGEVFSAAWRSRDRDVVIPPTVGSPAELAAVLRSIPEHDEAVIVGDGARRYADAWPRGIEVAEVPLPLAAVAARHAAAHPELAVAPHALQPIYVRRPDAVLARERAREAQVPRP